MYYAQTRLQRGYSHHHEYFFHLFCILLPITNEQTKLTSLEKSIASLQIWKLSDDDDYLKALVKYILKQLYINCSACFFCKRDEIIGMMMNNVV